MVNIILKKYERPSTSIMVEYGTFESYRAHVSHGTRIGNVRYALGLGSSHTDGPDDMNAAENLTNFYGYVGLQPLKKLTIDTRVFHLFGKRELRLAEAPANTSLQTGISYFDPVHATFVNVKSFYRFNKKASLELITYYTDRKNSFHSLDSQGIHETAVEKDYEWGINVTQALSPIKKNILRVGGLYNHWTAPNGKRYYTGYRCERQTVSLVVVDEQRIGMLNLDAGVRWAKTYNDEYWMIRDAFDNGIFSGKQRGQMAKNMEPIKNEWEPSVVNGNFGATYLIGDLFSVHGNFAAGMVPPRVGSLDTAGSTPEDERRIKVDLGVTASKDKLGRATLVGFYVKRQDGIVMSTVIDPETGYPLYLKQDLNQYGLELDVESRRLFNVGSFFVNTLLMKSKYDSSGTMADKTDRPEIITSGGISLSGWNAELNVYAKQVSEYENTRFAAPGSDPVLLGDYRTLNANLGYRFGRRKNTRLYLNVENIMDKEFSTVVGYPDFGRRFYAGVQHTL